MTAEKKQGVLIIGAAEVDLSDLKPLTLGDRRALKALGVDFLKMARGGIVGDPDEEAKFILFLIRKRRPETTAEEVDELPTMVTTSFLQWYARLSAEVDDPFSMRSTSSPTATAGASAKSEAEQQQS